jgi:hypothetical protein
VFCSYIWASAYVEEMELIDCGSNASSEEQHIALQPCHSLRWVFVSCSGCRHDCNVSLFNEFFFYNSTECVRSQWWKELLVVDDNAGIWGVK